MDQEQAQIKKKEPPLGLIALILGIIIGWLGNTWLGSNYAIHTNGGDFKIDTKTGKTWILKREHGSPGADYSWQEISD